VHKAKVYIQAEEVQESNYTITMQLYCTNLEKKDFFGKVSYLSVVCMYVCMYIPTGVCNNTIHGKLEVMHQASSNFGFVRYLR